MQFVDPVLLVGWVAAVLWVAWLGASIVRAWVAADRPPGAWPRLGAVWRARPVRGRILLVGLGCAAWLDVAQLEVVDSIEDRNGLSTVDPAITGWFVDHRSAASTVAAKLVSDAGGTATMGALALLSVVWLAWRRRWPQAGTVAVAALGAALMGTVMKDVLARARPPRVDQLVLETNASLPSGHALGSTVVLGILTAIAFGFIRRRANRVALATVVVVILAAVGLSRLYLGVHWSTDVLTGWLLGAAWLSVCVTALAVLTRRNPPASP
ncbi:MAG: phosphatase PAP2 family protein [Actinomycetota bacterium]|nr:phosphatase PAP2 family protein [Actinomycetota bacterium]